MHSRPSGGKNPDITPKGAYEPIVQDCVLDDIGPFSSMHSRDGAKLIDR
jgi:hypothetical protein